MKKQSNSSAAGRKLCLGKKTISNLQPSQMSKVVGGYLSQTCQGPFHCGGGGGTKNGNTCPDHNTCYTC